MTLGGKRFSEADWKKHIKQGLRDKRFKDETEPGTKIQNTTTVILALPVLSHGLHKVI